MHPGKRQGIKILEGYRNAPLLVLLFRRPPLPGELRGDALNAVVTQDQVAEVGQVSQFWRNSRDQVPT